MDPYEPQGILPNVLRAVDRPGQVARNVLAGRPGAAVRQSLDIIGDIIDAPLPGDWIPAATSREDYISGSELVGMDQTPGIGRTAADIGIGLVTDPLTYLSFGAIPAAKQAAMGGKYAMELGIPFTGGKMRTPLAVADQPIDPLSLAMRGADKAITGATKKLDQMASTSVAGVKPGYTEGYDAFKAWIRRAAGAENLSPDVQRRLTEATAEGSAASKLWTKQAQDAMRGLTPDERNLLTLANVGVDIGSLTPSAKVSATPLSGNFLADVDALARKYGKDPAKLTAAAQRMGDIGSRQFGELASKQAFFGGAPQENYLQRQWFGMEEPGMEFAAGSLPKAMKERKITTPEQAANLLNTGDVGLELDAAKLMLNRATQQGKMLERANLARGLAPGSTATLADDLAKEAREAIKSTPNLAPDDAVALERMLGGMPARGDVTGILAKMSRPIKGAMVYGVVIPKFGSLVRNKLGMGMQAAATPGVREEALTHLNPVNVLREMGKAWDEAYGSTVFGKADDISKDMALIEDAFKNAKQTDDVQRALIAAKRPDLADAVKYGVMDGFVSTEEMVKELGRNPGLQKWAADLYNAPGKMFQHMEQRGRLMTYKNLHKKGKPTQEAAQLTKDALYDYRISSPENRALRDVLPFAQFMAKSIPQQAKWISQRPAIGAASAPLFYDPSGEEGPVYPYMQGRSRIGVGEDEAGNALYLSGFGLPMESLDVLPNLSASPREAGRDVSQGLLSSTQPLLKTAGAFATGTDPFFGTPFGSYNKIPLVGNAGDAGRLYNVAAGTGLLEPFGGGALRQLGNLTDEKKPIGARVADVLTGAKLTAVDPNIAEQRVLTDYLEARPEVSQYRTFYMNEPDAEFTSLMGNLRAAKKRAKDARDAVVEAEGDVRSTPSVDEATLKEIKDAANSATMAAKNAIDQVQRMSALGLESSTMQAQAMEAIATAKTLAAELKTAMDELRSMKAANAEKPDKSGYKFEVERDANGFIIGVSAKAKKNED